MDNEESENNKNRKALVGIVMGSDSDLRIMKAATEVMNSFNIPFELTVVSAHRTPKRMMKYAEMAKERGLKVIIAGAGGAAHLPGMIAAITTLPVIGVPIKSSNSIDGWDSVLSILQMPNGVPVATVALDAAANAGLLAIQIIATHDDNLSAAVKSYKEQLEKSIEAKVLQLKTDWPNYYDI